MQFKQPRCGRLGVDIILLRNIAYLRICQSDPGGNDGRGKKIREILHDQPVSAREHLIADGRTLQISSGRGELVLQNGTEDPGIADLFAQARVTQKSEDIPAGISCQNIVTHVIGDENKGR